MKKALCFIMIAVFCFIIGFAVAAQAEDLQMDVTIAKIMQKTGKNGPYTLYLCKSEKELNGVKYVGDSWISDFNKTGAGLKVGQKVSLIVNQNYRGFINLLKVMPASGK